MQASRGGRRSIALCLSAGFFLAACTTGPMTVREVHYFAVPNGESTNYYRLRAEANTRLGVTEYRSGWFPASSVDYLFGDVSSEGGTSALEARSKLEVQINTKILSTNEAWLTEAAKPNPDPTTLDGLLRARRRVLAYPSADTPPYKGAFEIEYNPAKPIHTRYADQKLVFVLGSDPDQVVSQIANVAESEKSVLAINRLSEVIVQRARNDLAEKEGTEEVNKRIDDLIHQQIQLALGVAKGPDVTPGKVIKEIDTLVILLNSVHP